MSPKSRRPIGRAPMRVQDFVDSEIAKRTKVVRVNVVGSSPARMCVFPATTLLATRLSHVEIISAFSLSWLRSMSRSSVVGPRGATNMQRRGGRNFFLKHGKLPCHRLHRRLVPEAFHRNACTEVVPN